MSSSGQQLEVIYRWHGRPLGYRLLPRPAKVTLGPVKRATFAAPQAPGLPKRFRLLRPRGQGYRLRVGPGMTGRLALAGGRVTVDELLARPGEDRFLRRAGSFREVDVAPGDRGEVLLDPMGALRVSFRWVDPPEGIPRPAMLRLDPLLARCMAFALLLLGVLTGVALVIGGHAPARTLAIDPVRVATIVPLVRSFEEKVRQKKAAEKQAEQEAGGSKAKGMKGDAGRIGRADAKATQTVLPKGRQDILRERVSKRGLLGIVGSSRPAGSGLGKLFAANSDEIDQALNGLAGAKLAVGRGSMALSTAGVGAGGGGGAFGRIQGSGDIDTGGGRGSGRGKGPSLGSRGEREVRVEVQTGAPDSDGSLSKEQVSRVVRAHTAGIKYCYEKELQRQTTLAGKIELYWVILPDGSVERANVAASTMRSAAVEGCMTRQVKQWQFPKSDGKTVVQSYPFLFKGAV